MWTADGAYPVPRELAEPSGLPDGTVEGVLRQHGLLVLPPARGQIQPSPAWPATERAPDWTPDRVPAARPQRLAQPGYR